MTETITKSGREFVAEVAVGETNEQLGQYAVGTGTGDVDDDDQQLENEVYRAGSSDPDAAFVETGAIGTIEASLVVEGGTDVATNTSITEVGIFTDGGRMVYHEIADDPITVVDSNAVEFTTEIPVLNKEQAVQ